MKKILSILLAVMMIASLATLAVSADVYDEVEIEGLPEGVHGFDIIGNDSYDQLFEVTMKYFVASFTFKLEEQCGNNSDNGCIGLTIGGESYECFYFAHDIHYADEDKRGPGFDDDLRPQLRVGMWWPDNGSPFGQRQTIYVDGEEDALEGGSLLGEQVTITVECHIDVDETDDSWALTIDAGYLNGIRIPLNGGLDSVTAFDFQDQNYVGYGCKLTDKVAQIKFAQSMSEIKASVLTEGGMPDDTGKTDLKGDVIGGGSAGGDDAPTTTAPATTTTAPSTTTKAPATTNAPATTTGATNTTDNGDDDGLPVAAIVGIIAAVVVVVGVIVVVVVKKKK